MTPHLERLAADVHDAVARQDFAQAAIRADRFGELARQTAAALPAVRAAEVIGEACRSLESARRKACVARARLADRLRRLQQLAPYSATSNSALHTWVVNG